MNDLQQGGINDSASSAVDNLLFFGIKYKNALIGATLFFLLAAAGTYFWMSRQADRELEAGMQLSAVEQLLQRGDYRAAIKGDKENPGLETIAASYNGTRSGEMAALLLANAWYSLGEPDSALTAFNTVSMKNPDLQAAVLAGKGACFSNRKEYAKAAEHYEKASGKAVNNALKASYLVDAADCMAKDGKEDNARQRYSNIIETYPGSAGAASAQRSLWMLSGHK
ncbi:tetratricopeptide repeat protein [Chlorobium phaeovibrioides]|uniref:tetratricopeptide repeat protein n=1 Tax=Chlorobium phaeovibrioides TaxID=1094 RepID=UPI000F82804A|nr:tetratricopeptide repeat protein [Chlorobium phaeovibrioides]RTY34847.1 tetratricopeptide repeat protein [Chlorobium phaeovibrioides]